MDVVTRSEVESVLAWWRDAGVDTLVDETPRQWLAALAPRAARPETIAAPVAPKLADTLETLLEDLKQPTRFALCGARRVCPAPLPDATLMVLVDMPERVDLEEGRLLGGPLADRFDKMFEALEATRETVFVASLLPGRTPDGRVPGALQDEVRALARQLIRLARPKRLWLMGDAASEAVLGQKVVAASRQLHQVEGEAASIPTIVTPHPRLLANDPERKFAKLLWAEMQRLKERSE